jgi:hypothetical protein
MASPVRNLGAAAEGSSRRVGSAQRRLIARGMTERELAVLQDIDRFRFLTSKQIERLHFKTNTSPQAATRICNRVLQRLYSYRVIDHLERRVGGIRAGSASYVWMVGPTGEYVLRANDAVRIRRREPSIHFMRHCLAIADCVIAVQQLAYEGRLELLSLDTEPSCWRRFMNRSGGIETLKPDLAMVTATGEFEDSWFIEIDRGTESIPTLVKKCRQYLAYHRTGQAQSEEDVFPAVLWMLPSEQRLERLRQAMTAARSFDSSIFRLTTQQNLTGLVLRGAA